LSAAPGYSRHDACRSDVLSSSLQALNGRLDSLSDHVAKSLAATSQTHGALEREAAALRATCEAGTSELERRQQVLLPIVHTCCCIGMSQMAEYTKPAVPQ
jgi:hypothetical protein